MSFPSKKRKGRGNQASAFQSIHLSISTNNSRIGRKGEVAGALSRMQILKHLVSGMFIAPLVVLSLALPTILRNISRQFVKHVSGTVKSALIQLVGISKLKAYTISR